MKTSSTVKHTATAKAVKPIAKKSKLTNPDGSPRVRRWEPFADYIRALVAKTIEKATKGKQATKEEIQWAVVTAYAKKPYKTQLDAKTLQDLFNETGTLVDDMVRLTRLEVSKDGRYSM